MGQTLPPKGNDIGDVLGSGVVVVEVEVDGVVVEVELDGVEGVVAGAGVLVTHSVPTTVPPEVRQLSTPNRHLLPIIVLPEGHLPSRPNAPNIGGITGRGIILCSSVVALLGVEHWVVKSHVAIMFFAPPVPVCVCVKVEGFPEEQVPVVGSNCESPVHLVPVLVPPAFPVFIGVGVVVVVVVVVAVPVLLLLLLLLFPVCVCVFVGVVDGFPEVQLPVVGSKFESPLHFTDIEEDDSDGDAVVVVVVVAVPVLLPPAFPVFICVVVVVVVVPLLLLLLFPVCVEVEEFFGTHFPSALSIKSSGHVCWVVDVDGDDVAVLLEPLLLLPPPLLPPAVTPPALLSLLLLPPPLLLLLCFLANTRLTSEETKAAADNDDTRINTRNIEIIGLTLGGINVPC